MHPLHIILLLQCQSSSTEISVWQKIALPDGQLSTSEKLVQMPWEDSCVLCFWSLNLGHGSVKGGSLYPQSCWTSSRLVAGETEMSTGGYKSILPLCHRERSDGYSNGKWHSPLESQPQGRAFLVYIYIFTLIPVLLCSAGKAIPHFLKPDGKMGLVAAFSCRSSTKHLVCTCEFVLWLLALSPSFLLMDGKAEKQTFTMLLAYKGRPPGLNW